MENGPKVKRKSTLSRALVRGFALLGVLVVLLSAVEYWADQEATEARSLVVHLHATIENLQDLQRILYEAETGSRAYVITGKEEFSAPFTKAKEEFDSKFAEIPQLIEHDLQQSQRLRELEELARKTMEHTEKIINTKKAGKHEEAVALISADIGVHLMNDSQRKATELIEAELARLKPRQQSVERTQFYSTLMNVGGSWFSVFVGCFLIFYIFRGVVRPIRDVTQTIASASTDIAATVEQHEKTAIHQSASVNETTTTIEELEHSFRQMDEAADAAGARANQAILLAEEGSKTVTQSLAGITDLKEKVGDIAEQILQLSEQTSQIGAVINLVSDLANQTNMLALNAAVEAARAGDHGKGFAVVAAEIRKLADQSRKSAEKVNTLVADIRKATDATVMVTEEGTKTAAQGMELALSTAEAFNSLKSSLSTIVENFQQTQLSINQQLIAVKQVTQAMEDVNNGTKETSAAINQTKAGIDQLKDTVQKLGELV
ncbi:MAG TPA: methyl-accepting chemotaxis protein [Candidatus Binatia bacterium]|jgi:methyl-accepting chemotaxis protein|nr:methyl-accepting chemotaxis protein [Candidatus Binatia bacterium]